jgi:hypothetical protein
MALTFRYRFVDFGTVFSAGDGIRAVDQGSASPNTLFTNELVVDVGGTCVDGDETLAVIDHHFAREAQFPAASAAVLHKAKYIRRRFADTHGVVWLVTHKQPDFDAFCSMYLARWILEDPAAAVEWEPFGLHPDGWLDSEEQSKINWFVPDLHSVPFEQRWPLLMAAYASIVDNGKHFPCPRNKALHSVLYAALQRGRDYLSETSGAKELFDEIRGAIRDRKRNPIFDSVLQESREFAPELEMLDREVEAYHRDLRRARRSIVYLQRSLEPFPTFFDRLKHLPLLDDGNAIRPEHLLADEARMPTDAIYVRDPECLLFKEWARLDLENSMLGRGFEFTAVAYSSGRPAGETNHTDYFFAIDPERANGRHLYRVWARLQAKEVASLRQNEAAQPEKAARRNFEGRAGNLGKYFADPWFDGQNYLCTIVATPNQGTTIAAAGSDGGLNDDAVVELVRSEVEHSVYQTTAGAESASVIVCDLSATRNDTDVGPYPYDIGQLQQIPAPAERRFRFARIPLRDDVPVSLAGRNGLSEQIGETLWQVLYPDLKGAKPHDFAQRNLVVAPRFVGVWGDRGIAIAHKPKPQTTGTTAELQQDDNGTERDFIKIVGLARAIDQLIADGEGLARENHSAPHGEDDDPTTGQAEEIAARGEVLARTVAQIKHNLTLPHSDLLRRFYDATGIDELLSTLRDLNQNAAEYLRRRKMDEQASKTRESTETVAEVQTKLEYLEVFIVGVYALEMLDTTTKYLEGSDKVKGILVITGGLGFLIVTAAMLVPWNRVRKEKSFSARKPLVVLLCALLAWVGAILWGIHFGFKDKITP